MRIQFSFFKFLFRLILSPSAQVTLLPTMTIYASVIFDYWVVVSKKSTQYYLLSEKFSEFLI